MRIARESWIIVAIGIADLVTTLIWVSTHGAQEANPIFRQYLAMGPFWFALMKMILLLGPVLVLEWARRKRPAFTAWGSRFAIVAYLSLYFVGVAKLNPQLLQPGTMYPPGTTLAQVDSDFNSESTYSSGMNISPENLRSGRARLKHLD